MRTEIVNNLSFENYRASQGLSKHALDTFAVAPAMYLHKQANPTSPSRAMVMGTLIHAQALESEIGYAVGPKVDRRTKAGKEEWENFCFENAGLEIITREEADIIHGVSDAAQMLIEKYCSKEQLVEQSMYWGRGGVQCKGRPDLICTINGEPAIVDLKTTQDITSFDKKFYHFKYDIQAAWYAYGAGKALGVFPEFYFLVVDTEAPYLSQLIHTSDRVMEQADMRIDDLLVKYAQCQATGNFTEGLSELRSI
jgi:exodeoxyribonuclease VIII